MAREQLAPVQHLVVQIHNHEICFRVCVFALKLTYRKLIHVISLTTPDVRTLAMDDASESVLPDFVDLAKKNVWSSLLVN